MGLPNTSPWQNFAKQLMTDFQTQYGAQSAIFQYLSGVLQPMIQGGGQGYANPTLAAMRTGASDTISTQFQNAEKALQNNTPQDAGLPSGVQQQLKAQLAASGARAESTAQNNITLANEEQRQNNLRFATNGLLGVASGYAPLGYAGAANQAGDTVANMTRADAAMNESSKGFGDALTTGLGAGLGKAISGRFDVGDVAGMF